VKKTLFLTVATSIITPLLVCGITLTNWYYNLTLPLYKDALAAISDTNVPKFYLPPSRCSTYAVTVSHLLGTGEYAYADAWDVDEAGPNKSIWEGTAQSISELEHLLLANNNELQIGDMIGIYDPNSNFNLPGRGYTHIAYYFGDGIVFQQYGPLILKSDLDDFLSEIDGEIKEVIRAGKNTNQKNQIEKKEIIPGFYELNYGKLIAP